MYAAAPDVHLGLAGWVAAMVTCGITVAFVLPCVVDHNMQSELPKR